MFKRMTAVGVLAVAMVSGCTGETPDPPPTPSPTMESMIHPDASEYLTVVDSGFTVGPGADGGSFVSYAIILENQNPDYAAYKVGVDVGWVDDSGEPVEVLPPEGGPAREHDPLWIPPGATWVLADVVEVAEPPAEFALSFTEDDTFNQWLAYERLSGTGELSVLDAAVVAESEREAAGWWEAALTVESTFGRQLNAVNLAAVFRDADGVIVGGGKTYGQLAPQVNHGENLVTLTTPVETMPETADLAQTDYHAQLTWSTVWEPQVN